MDKLTFYFDVCFGRRYEWLAICGQRNWIAFSHDRKFHGIEVEIAAIKQHSVGCFYLWGANDDTFEKLRCFVRGYDEITRLARTTPKPFIYQSARNGRLTKIEIP